MLTQISCNVQRSTPEFDCDREEIVDPVVDLFSMEDHSEDELVF